MATLENRAGRYRIVFRFGGRKYARSLKTDKSTQAQACLASLEDNLHRLNLGTLVPPDDVDLITLLLSDGRQYKKPQARSMRSIPSGALEDCTICGMQIHSGHITRALVSAGTQNQPGGENEKQPF